MREIKPGLNGAELRIAVVRARFNEPIGAGLLAACLERLTALGVAPGRVTVVSVPGARSLTRTFSIALATVSSVLKPMKSGLIRPPALDGL